MTECHRNGRCKLADDVQRRQKRRGLRKTLQILQRSALAFIIGYQTKDENRPTRNDVQIRSRSVKSEQRKQTRKRRQRHYRGDKRRKTVEIGVHVRMNKFFRLLDDKFGEYLADTFSANGHTVRQKFTQPEYRQNNKP